MDFFTADLHINDMKIISQKRRPFDNVDHMNDTLLANINSLVKEDDRLYILGNFLYGSRDDGGYIRCIKYNRKKINCKNVFLVFGNLDRRGRRYKTFRCAFTNCSDYLEIKSGEISLVMSHYPIADSCWNRVEEAIHLHGHMFGKLDNVGANRLDVGVDHIARVLSELSGKDGVDKELDGKNYRPISTGEICKLCRKITVKLSNHLKIRSMPSVAELINIKNQDGVLSDNF